MRTGEKGAAPALALWALLAGSSIYKILGVLALTACAEALLFYGRIRGAGDSGVEYQTLAAAVEGSHISMVFLAALGLMYLLLIRTERRMESKSGGTMRRLRLSQREVFWIQTIYNGACLILLFGVQIWLCIWMTGVYGRGAQEAQAPPQRLFLAFYRIDFLHCLLPMAETVKWVRNLLLVLAFSMEAAGSASKAEYASPIMLYTLTAGWLFVSPLGGNLTDWIGMLLYGLMIAVNVWKTYKPERRTG